MDTEPIASRQRDILFETLKSKLSKDLYRRQGDFRQDLSNVSWQVIQAVECLGSRERLGQQTTHLLGE